MISEKTKTAIFCEITCPNEQNLLKRQKEKENKYAHLTQHLNAGWKGYLFILVIGAKGFVLKHCFNNFSKSLGLTGRESRKLKNVLSQAAIRSSFVIWLNRFNQYMDKRRIIPLQVPEEKLYPTEYLKDNPTAAIQSDPAAILLSLKTKKILPPHKSFKQIEGSIPSFMLLLPTFIRAKLKSENEKLDVKFLEKQ